MAKNTRNVPQKEQKHFVRKIWKIAALFRNAVRQSLRKLTMKVKPIAEMAHMIAYSDDGPRSDPALAPEDRNKASNLILICPTHHTLVDKFEHQYNVHVLREMKRQHEGKFAFPESKKNPAISQRTTSCIIASFIPSTCCSVFQPTPNTTKLTLMNSLTHYLLQTIRTHSIPLNYETKKLYTFHDLRTPNNPLFGTYDQSTVKPLESAKTLGFT